MAYDLGDYEQVADRIERFHTLFPEGRIVVNRPELIQAGDQLRILVSAAVYPDPHTEPCIDWAAEPFPGTTPYTRGSEWENASTSAVGRALRLVLPGRHTATASEIGARHHDQPTTTVAEWLYQLKTATSIDQVETIETGIRDAQQLNAEYRGSPLSAWIEKRTNQLTDQDPA